MLKFDINLVFTIVNILILFIAMRIVLFKPVHKILDERQRLADEAMNAAKAKQEEADKMMADYQAQMRDIDTEREMVLSKAKADAAVEAQQIISDGKKQAEAAYEEAMQNAASDKQKLMKQAQNEIQEMILVASDALTAERTGADSDRTLYDNFLDKVVDTDEKDN